LCDKWYRRRKGLEEGREYGGELSKAGLIFNLPSIILSLLLLIYKAMLLLGEVRALLDLKARGRVPLTLLS
jgi:hypothetical protein